MQAVFNDRRFCRELCRIVQLLKITAAAASKIGTFRLHPNGRWIDNFNDLGKGNLAFLFTNTNAVVLAGAGALAVVGLGQPAQGIIFALGGSLRGAGDTRYPLMVSFVNWFLVRLPLSYALAFPFGMGLTGIWLGVTADYFVRAVLLALRFRSGAWARVRV